MFSAHQAGPVMLIAAMLLCAVSFAASPAAEGVAAQAPSVIKAGPLTITVHISPTAHVFHLVDQLANWSPYCHPQYKVRYFATLSETERNLLDEHAGLRESMSWGRGLEQTFYTDLPLAEALDEGVRTKLVTQEQADIERRVLAAFEERANAMLAENRAVLGRFEARLKEQQPALEKLAKNFGRFCGVEKVDVPVYLIASPADNRGGGGYNGGRLTLEVPRKKDALDTFMHEIMHAFLDQREDALTQAAAQCPSLDVEILSEGLAYALSPGLLHSDREDSDPLVARVSASILAQMSLDEPYTRSHRFGLALRPLLGPALAKEEGTLDDFLPRAVDAWRVTVELSKAIANAHGGNAGAAGEKWIGKESSRPTLFILAQDGAVFDAFRPRWPDNTYGRSHEKTYYDEVFKTHAKPGDVLVLAFSLDDPARIPPEYERLLPAPWAEMEALAAAGEDVERRGTAENLSVIALVAPTAERLLALARGLDLQTSEQ